MPASWAPTGLPPVAIVYTPQRVLVSTMWSMTVNPTAHQKPEKSAPPIQSANPPRRGVLGNASEIVSVTPLRKNSIPSVVMNDGTPVTNVITPLVSPTSEATKTAKTRATGNGNPQPCAESMTKGAKA